MALTEKAVIGTAVYDGENYWKIVAWVDNEHEVVVRKVRPHLIHKTFPHGLHINRFTFKVITSMVAVKNLGWLFDKCILARTFAQIDAIEKGISK
jgi:hypothetical protein